MVICRKAALMVVVGLVLPFVSQAQGLADEMKGMHSVLEELYDDMMPLCSHLIGVGQGIAGFAATWFIASRVWRHIACAEPIDFYPLFRPFVLGFCIMIFPSVLAMLNGILKPTVTGTAALVENSDKAIAVLLKQKEEAVKKTPFWLMYESGGPYGMGDRDAWYRYTHDGEDPSKEGYIASLGNDVRFAIDKYSYDFRNSVKEVISVILTLLFEFAALCIDTLRTFQLVVLAILGPIVFGLSIFNGFQHTLTTWLARYINIFLWLPVANIFGGIIAKIQEKMLQLDIKEIAQYGDTMFSGTDLAYLAFLVIGIIGYTTVPSVANFIVQAGAGSALTHKTTNMIGSTSSTVVNTGSQLAGLAADGLTNAANRAMSPYFNNNENSSSGYMGDKLKGNP